MSNIVLFIMVLFSIISGIDKLLGNRKGLGERFEEGFKSMGPLAITMVGIISLSPVIAQLARPILSPLSKLTGSDPSIFVSSLLATDMGGYSTSVEIAGSQQMAEFSGLILASMLGATISFTMPLALNLVSKEDFPFFTKGVLIGIVTIPLGMVVGGLAMGISIKEIWMNLIPVIILSLLIVIGLFKFHDITVRIFNLIGKGIMTLSLIGLLLSIIDAILGIRIIPHMASFEEGIIIVGKIGIVLSGAYPMFHLVQEKFKFNLSKITAKIGMNQFSILGLISSLANCVPMLAIYDKMDAKGKIINAAFVVSGAFVFGGQLGFVSGISKRIVSPFILAKLSAGLSSIFLANLLLNQAKNSIEKENN
ncbi:ethanolamine utilization protein EutH [Tepidimicrobium xylanilyticum]|uniref:Ethanolamine transporter n=1 Tax=Tepidimicrobium xylanilyticum TaxID=1123352 RepID=A0A1H2UZC3_9FIRM|nr:ethanolamine utilization protein EutH [Tepidimicrobium xylanilyticum]GMG96781.1 ethanolamine utilization protein EutH [Tepidimicrobium xylanilyticum]SDW60984.1 ethanolamine transporter [Tepidimicrobium xylanilyticum]